MPRVVRLRRENGELLRSLRRLGLLRIHRLGVVHGLRVLFGRDLVLRVLLAGPYFVLFIQIRGVYRFVKLYVLELVRS